MIVLTCTKIFEIVWYEMLLIIDKTDWKVDNNACLRMLNGDVLSNSLMSEYDEHPYFMTK